MHTSGIQDSSKYRRSIYLFLNVYNADQQSHKKEKEEKGEDPTK